MYNKLWLLNKGGDETNTTFTVWSEAAINIVMFIEGAQLIKEIPKNFDRKDGVSKGYWVDIMVKKENFEKVVAEIKNIFKDSKKIDVCENFDRKEWDTHTYLGRL